MKIKSVEKLSFGLPERYPMTRVETYQNRIKIVVQKMHEQSINFLILYSDREHSANQEFLIGVGPRFEESLLIISDTEELILLHGNECAFLAPDTDLNVQMKLFQDFSPMGQQRNNSQNLMEIFKEIGIKRGSSVGVVGWKSYQQKLFPNQKSIIDVPTYIIDDLRTLIGDVNKVSNEGNIFYNPDNGLRIICSSDEIAQFEYSARVVSNAVQTFLDKLEINKSERSFEKYLDSFGLPLSCHKMISFGDKVKRGLTSPGDGLSQIGTPAMVALGVSGALTARAGMLAHENKELHENIQSFYEEFSANYWISIITWYENLKIGASGGEIFSKVSEKINSKLFNLMLNPGHNLHIEEWSNSIFSYGNEATLKSGMVLQSDLIPVSNGPFCYSNAEDGVAIGDEALRNELRQKYPEMWNRILSRKEFIHKALGIQLDDSVLPLSDMCCYYAPYMLSPEAIYVK